MTQLTFTEAQLAEAREELRQQMLDERKTKNTSLADDIRRLKLSKPRGPVIDETWRVKR